MKVESTRPVHGVLVATIASLAWSGCAAPAAKTAASAEFPHAYRLDFVVASGDGHEAPRRQAFTMNVVESQYSDILVGKNIQLTATGSSAASGARTDVGFKLGAECRTQGDEVLIKVRVDESDAVGGLGSVPFAIEKTSASADCLAKMGQSTLALRIDEGEKKLEVSVIPTRLR